MKTYFAEILLPLAIPKSFTYRIPQFMESQVIVGMRVVVPFGKNKLVTGIVLRIHENPPKEYSAKYIDSLLDSHSVVTAHQIKLWFWMADYYMCHPGEVLTAALPAGLRLSSESKYILNPAFDGDISGLKPREVTLLDALANREVMTGKEVIDILEIKSIQQTMKKLIEKGAVLIIEDLKERYKPKIESYVELTDEAKLPGGLELAFEKLKNAPKQEEVLMMYVQLSHFYGERKDVKKTVLQKKSNSSSATLQELVKKNIFKIAELEVGRLPEYKDSMVAPIELSVAQQQALTEIQSEFKVKNTVLLHGVTSSGKTEIYVELIREELKKGKQVLYILPEIALTTQMIQRMQKYFGNDVWVYHSKFNQNERVEIWNEVLKSNSGEGKLFLGARSAVFLPFSNLGLVIVDEEHESSFKQYNPAPRYHARDTAIILASLHKAKSLLGSATPSYESLFNAQTGKYGYVTLSERYGGIELPEIITASLSKKNTPTGHFTTQLLEEIKNSLELKEQVILFQNRRGYAPVVVCEMCGWSPECTRCDVTLTYHKSQNRTICHYCGSKFSVPHLCAACGSHKLKLAGFGTERIEDEILIQFPDAKVARLDLDTTRSKYGYQTILSDFQDGNIDVLIGTQMITKGLDFGNVNLVGIVNADLLLRFPDFRATERGYQLMTQVAGRAGRRDKRGKVIIQSYDPDQWVVQQVVIGNFEEVAKVEIEERRKFGYPPYTRLIRLTFIHKEIELVDFCAQTYHDELTVFLNRNFILGPEYPSVARIKNRFHKNIILKLPRNLNLTEVKTNLKNLNDRLFSDKKFRPVRMVIDVDPQ